jgi:hypothetical protein
MAKEQVDPVYKYVDGKIKLIKRDLQQLKNAQLNAERSIAALKVNSDANTFNSVIVDDLPNNKHLITQMLIDATAVKSAVYSSKTPLDLATTFYQKWSQTLRKLGAETTEF